MGQGDHLDPYRRSFEAILDGAVILDSSTGRILLANKAAAAIFNFPSPEEMVGINPLDHIPDEDRGPVAHLLAKGLQVDRPIPAEIRMRTTDGQTIWVSITTAITEHEGKKATLATLREITSEKPKDAALRQAEHLYRRLFETMLDGAVVLDTTTSRVVQANQSAAQMFGFAAPEEMVGQNPLDYVPREDQERVVRLIADTIERGHLPPTGIGMRTKDGRLLWVSVSMSLIEYEGKKASLATIRDITSDREKEAALKEAERQYEHLFDGMVDAAVVLDVSSFEIVLANKAAAEMFGFASPREVIGENPLSYIPEEDRDGVARLIALNLEGKATNPAELRVLTRDKRERWVSATATRVDYEGRTATLSTLRDITADKLKDDALRAAEESKLRLMDASSEAITIVQDGKLVYVNPAVAKGAGISQQQLIGLAFMDLVHPDERQAVWERYQRILAGEWTPDAATIKGVDVNGQTLWSEVREIPFTWQGRPAVMSLIHDVTDRIRAEEERKEKEERLRTIVENAWDGISIFDEDFRVQFESPSIARMTGYTPEEWTGSRPEAFNVHPDDLPSLVSTLESLKSQPGAVVRDFKIRYRHRDGSWRWIEATGQNLLHDPKVRGIVVNFHDITDRINAEEEIKTSAARLAKAQQIAHLGSWELDVANNRLTWSDETYRIFGLQPQEFASTYEAFLDVVHRDDRAAVDSAYSTSLAEGSTSYEIEHRIIRKSDGAVRFVHERCEHIRDESGRPVKSVGMVHDITDKVLAEVERKEKEERLRAIVENAWDGVIIFDGNYSVLFESPSLPRMTGYSPEEWQGRSPAEWPIHPDDLPSILARLEELRGRPGLTIPGIRMRLRHKDGSWRTLEATGQNLLQDPKVKGIVVNFRDITENVRADEERKASEERFRTLIERATDVVIVLDATGKLTYQSPSLERVTGFGHDEWVGRSLDQLLIHPDDLPSLAALLERVLSQPGATFEGVTARYQHKDGSWHTLEATVTNMLHDPKVAGIVANFRDITDRKLAQVALAESEKKYRLLVENSNDVIFSVDPQGNFTYVSPAIERISGYRVDEVVGTSFVRFVVPEDLAGLMASFEKTLRGASEPAEFRGLRKDGAVRYVRTTSRLTRQEGQVVGLTGVMSDITERREAEEALKMSEALLRETEELASVGGWEYNVQTGVTAWTDETYRIHEIPNVPTIDHIAESLKCYPPPARQAIEEAFQKCVKEGIPYDLELPFVTFGGNERWIRTTAKAVSEGNRVVRVMGNIADITARKQVEEDLRASEERNRLLIDNAAEVVTVVQDGLIRFISRSSLDLSGYLPEELISKSFTEIIHPDDRQTVAENYVKRLRGEPVPTGYSFRIFDKSGDIRWVAASVTLFTWEGRPATLALLTDITERKEAEQALKEAKAYAENVIQTANVLFVALDKDGRVTQLNRAGERITGYQQDEVLGKNWFELIVPRERYPEVWEAFEKVKGEGAIAETFENPILTKSGEERIISWKNSTLVLNDEVVGTLSFGMDITERKQAEKTLRESEEGFRLLTEKTNDLIYTTDLDFNDTYVSPSVEKILGFTPAEHMARSPDQQMTLESLARAQEALLEHLSLDKDAKADPKRTLRIELEYYHKHGRTVWLEHQVSAMRDADGTVIGLHGVARDVSERRKAEQAVRESEGKYRLLAEKTHDIIWISDLTLHTTYVSPSVERILGFTPEERIMQDVSAQMTPESLDRASKALTRQLALEQDPISDPNRALRIELEYYRKDGSTVWLESQVSGIRDASGNLVAFHGVARDISERKQAELALQETKERYRALFDRSVDSVYVHDFEGNMLDANDAALNLLGYDREDIPHLSFARLLSEDQIHAALATLEELKETGTQKRTTQYTLRRKDGGVVNVETVASVIHHEGRPYAIQGIARDVTERRKAEQLIRESEEKYRLLTEKTSDLIYTTDLSFRNIYVSPSVERILGFTPEEHMERDAAQQMTPESLARAGEALLEQLALEQDPEADPNRTVRIELECYRKDGSTVWLEQHVSFIRDDSGTVVGLHGGARDITERRRMEQSLRERLKELQCIANVSRLAERPEMPIEEFVHGAVRFLPPAWQYPDVCAARIGFDSKEFKTANYRETEWSQSADITVDEKRFGTVTVCYLEERPVADEGPFLKEERDLINTVADFLGHVIQHRLMEQSLHASEQRYRLLADNATDIIWVVDANLNLTYVSPSAASLLGYSLEELMTGSFDKALTPESLASVAQVYMDDLAGENVTPGSIGERIVEIEAVCKDGQTVWLEAVTKPFRDADGRLSGFHGACRDITKRRRAQEALKDSEERFRTLIEKSTDVIAILDSSGNLVYETPSFERITGYNLEDWAGKPVGDWLLHPDDLAAMASLLEKVLRQPDAISEEVSVRFKHKDGTWHYLEGTVRNLLNDPKVGGLVINYRDVTERVKGQETLRESEERFRALVQNLQDVILILDEDGTVVLENPATAAAIGESLLGKSAFDVVHPEDVFNAKRAFNDVVNRVNDDSPLHLRMRRTDGSWLDMEVLGANLFDDISVRGMLVVCRDVTQRLKAQRELRDSEERFRSLVEKATDAVAVLDAAGNVLYYTPSMLQVTGYKPGEWVDKSLSDLLLHPDDLPKLVSVLEELLKAPGASVENFTTRYQHQDGTWHVLEATARNMLHDPKIAGIVANFRDITERVKADQALKESEERFRGLVETTSDWVWEIDRNSRYTYVSPRVRDVLGYEPEDLLGHTPFQFMHQREGRRVSKIVRRFAAENLPFSLLENTCVHKDGHSVVMETSAVPIIGGDGSFFGYRGIDRDITERKKVEQELQRSLKRLEKTMESTIEAITNTIETRDPYTTGHQMRVTDLACTVAKVMEVPPTQIEGIRVAGLLHDIGKIAIPTEILSKPGKLNDVEYEMIKTHSKVGYNILKKIEFPWPVARTVLQHHERWNGSGYPHGIRGEDILLEARILAVADVMEAMSSHRPYRPTVGADKALEEITKNSGILYDPAVVKACVTAFAEAGFKFPPAMPGAAEMEGTSSIHPVQ